MLDAIPRSLHFQLLSIADSNHQPTTNNEDSKKTGQEKSGEEETRPTDQAREGERMLLRGHPLSLEERCNPLLLPPV